MQSSVLALPMRHPHTEKTGAFVSCLSWKELRFGYDRSVDYTMIWNCLDYTALTIPVCRVDESLDVKRPPHQFYSNEDKTNYELCTLLQFFKQRGTEFDP